MVKVGLITKEALWKAVHMSLGVPLEYPRNDDDSFCTTTHSGCEDGSFEGFCNHYNFVKTKYKKEIENFKNVRFKF